MLEDRLKAGSLNVGNVMNFLNRHNTRVDGNWPRLNALLEYAKDNRLPPGGWATQIMVNALGDFSAQSGPFVVQDDGEHDEEEKEGDDHDSKEGSRDAPLDFTQDSSAPSTPLQPSKPRNSKPSGLSNKFQAGN
ncbi:hypothetical protein ON010_g5325 [Phytophthora cinnamomi]|nr:hypothetical protein ON010_g5325 [Phytophthora cinnamomi]